MAVTTTHSTGTSGKFQASMTGFAANNDASGMIAIPAGTKKLSVQALGDFSGSLSIRIEGSNDGGVTFGTLVGYRSGQTTVVDLDFAAAGVGDVLSVPDVIRARATAGSGGGDADIHLCGYYDA